MCVRNRSISVVDVLNTGIDAVRLEARGEAVACSGQWAVAKLEGGGRRSGKRQSQSGTAVTIIGHGIWREEKWSTKSPYDTKERTTERTHTQS